MRKYAQEVLLICTALFAVVWAIARAGVQSITIDEAVTYVNFVRLPPPAQWAAHANNHLLNSLIMRVFTWLFGTSHITVRSGALTGAVIYIACGYWFSRLITRDFILRLALFTCLVFNPLVFDFLVAARGYGLASAFLLCAIYIAARAKQRQNSGQSVVGALCLFSGCIALSFVANFSFAVVDIATVLLIFLWMCWNQPRAQYARLAAACVLPGFLIAGIVAGPTLIHWPKDELTYGAQSLQETVESLAQSSLYEPDSSVLPRRVFRAARFVSEIILPLLAIAAAWRVLLILFNRSSLRDPHVRWLLGLSTVPACAMMLALAVHWLAFRFFRIPLPMDRTAIYLVVLGTLFAGILAAVPIASLAGKASQHALLLTLVVLGSYFTLCLRLTYFKEWRWDWDMKNVYAALMYYNQTCGLKDIAVNWRYDAALNYYVVASANNQLEKFESTVVYPLNKHAYLVYLPEDEGFIAEHKLKAVYGSPSKAVLAIDPNLDASCEMSPAPTAR